MIDMPEKIYAWQHGDDNDGVISGLWCDRHDPVGTQTEYTRSDRKIKTCNCAQKGKSEDPRFHAKNCAYRNEDRSDLPQEIDVVAMKMPLPRINADRDKMSMVQSARYAYGWNDCIDHLISRGFLKGRAT